MTSPALRHHGAIRRDPADRAQLESCPVPLRRITALFAPHRARIAAVVALIAAASALGLATPFLTRHIIDVALPAQDLALLAALVPRLPGVSARTAGRGGVRRG